MVSWNLHQAHLLEVCLRKIPGDHETLSIVCHVGEACMLALCDWFLLIFILVFSKSNWLHVDIFCVFFLKWGTIYKFH